MEGSLSPGERRRGAHYTPRDVAGRVAGAALPDPARTGAVVDPACGAGALLLGAADRLAALGGDRPRIARHLLCGADLDPLAVAVAERRSPSGPVGWPRTQTTSWSATRSARPVDLAGGPERGLRRRRGQPAVPGAAGHGDRSDGGRGGSARAGASAPSVGALRRHRRPLPARRARAGRAGRARRAWSSRSRRPPPATPAPCGSRWRAEPALVELWAPAGAAVRRPGCTSACPSSRWGEGDGRADWSAEIAAARGTPRVDLGRSRRRADPERLVDRARVLAWFRDEYYGLVAHVARGRCTRPDGPDAPPRPPAGDRRAHRRGPLPVGRAAGAVRQAVLGPSRGRPRRPCGPAAAGSRVARRRAGAEGGGRLPDAGGGGRRRPGRPLGAVDADHLVVPHDPAEVPCLLAAACSPPASAWAAARAARVRPQRRHDPGHPRAAGRRAAAPGRRGVDGRRRRPGGRRPRAFAAGATAMYRLDRASREGGARLVAAAGAIRLAPRGCASVGSRADIRSGPVDRVRQPGTDTQGASRLRGGDVVPATGQRSVRVTARPRVSAPAGTRQRASAGGGRDGTPPAAASTCRAAGGGGVAGRPPRATASSCALGDRGFVLEGGGVAPRRHGRLRDLGRARRRRRPTPSSSATPSPATPTPPARSAPATPRRAGGTTLIGPGQGARHRPLVRRVRQRARRLPGHHRPGRRPTPTTAGRYGCRLPGGHDPRHGAHPGRAWPTTSASAAGSRSSAARWAACRCSSGRVMFPERVRRARPHRHLRRRHRPADRLVVAPAAGPSRLDPNWRGGDYYDAAPGDGPHDGLAARPHDLARSRSAPTTCSPTGSAARWSSRSTAASSCGSASRSSATSTTTATSSSAASTPTRYLLLTKAMDLHDLGRGRGRPRRRAAPASQAPVLADRHRRATSSTRATSSGRSSSALAAGGATARYVEIDSPHGHDAFLSSIDQVGAALVAVPRRRGEQPMH